MRVEFGAFEQRRAGAELDNMWIPYGLPAQEFLFDNTAYVDSGAVAALSLEIEFSCTS